MGRLYKICSGGNELSITVSQKAVASLTELNVPALRKNPYIDASYVKILLLSCLGINRMEPKYLNRLHKKFLRNMFEVRNSERLPFIDDIIAEVLSNAAKGETPKQT